jgi:uncharacterized protein with HEPN domain
MIKLVTYNKLRLKRAVSWKAWTKNDFLADKRTQLAVIMSLIIVGEAATKVMDDYIDFTQQHPEIPWCSMRNMRNRMAHGYFEINLEWYGYQYKNACQSYLNN